EVYIDAPNRAIALRANGNTGISGTDQSVLVTVNSTQTVRIRSGLLDLAAAAAIGWTASGGATGIHGTRIRKASAGVVQVADGSNNDATLQAALLIASGSKIRIATAATPTVAGTVGDMQWDNDNIYVYTSDGWKKAALTAVE